MRNSLLLLLLLFCRFSHNVYALISRLHVFSQDAHTSQQLQVGRPVSFEMSIVDAAAVNQTFFLLQSGELNANGLPAYTLTNSTLTQFTYLTPGMKQCSLTVSDMPFTVPTTSELSVIPYSTLSNGLSPITINTNFTIFPSQGI